MCSKALFMRRPVCGRVRLQQLGEAESVAKISSFLSVRSRVAAELLWFGTLRRQVRHETDLLIQAHGPLADRYARDHIRLARDRRRKRDLALYIAVAEEIAIRREARSTEEIVARNRQSRPIACAAGAVWLPDCFPTLNAVIAVLA
jgi:hypothetical protein